LAKLGETAALAARRAAIDAFNRTSPVIKEGLATFPLKFASRFNLRPEPGRALLHVYPTAACS